MSKSIRDDIIRKAEENLARKESERQRAITGETERVTVQPTSERKSHKFNPERFVLKLIVGTGFIWAINWTLYYFLYKPDEKMQRYTIAVFVLIPVYAVGTYAGYLIIRIVAKSYWEFAGCAWLLTLLIGLLGMFGLILRILAG